VELRGQFHNWRFAVGTHGIGDRIKSAVGMGDKKKKDLCPFILPVAQSLY